MRCPECGADVSPGVRYCRECGERIDLPAEPAESDVASGIAATIPLMAPGATVRNVLVGLLYLAFFLITVPLGLAYAVATNRRGLGDRLADSPLGAVPPIRNGGWQAGVTVFVTAFVLLLLVTSALGGGGEPAEPSPVLVDDETGENATATDTPSGTPVTDGGTPAATRTSTAAGGATPTAAGAGPPTANPTTSAATPSTATATPSTPAAGGSTPESDSTPASDQRSSWTVTVLDVVDGDTMRVRMPDGSEDTIRLLGVDTPETSASRTDPDEWEGIPDDADGREWLESWGHEATGYAEQRLGGDEIYIETDSESDRRGTYDRLLVYAYQSESASKAFNLRLIENGYARMYDTQFEQRSTYRSAESAAQSNDVGVWDYEAAGTPTPGSGSGNADGLYVSEVHADAEGNDHNNLNDEYVVFSNDGDEPIEMGGWRVADEADHVYRVPSGFTLDPGASVTLYTGDGENTDDELYWGESQAVWNNGGDTIYVRNDDGETVLEHEYSG